jgi:uncharacterized protein with HEPN domain
LQRDPKSLLRDAREAANAIAAMTAGKTFADFDRDIVLRSAVASRAADRTFLMEK